MNDRNRIIVTGANGFIGAAIVNALDAMGLPVIAVTRSAAAVRPLVRTVRLENYESLCDMPDLLSQTQAIFHLAGGADRKTYNADNQDHAAKLVARLADTCARVGISRFVLASSIYADRPERSVYGRSKVAAEQALAAHATMFETAVALRLPPVYGPGSKGMFGLLARHIAARHPLPIGWATRPRRFLGIGNLQNLACHLISAGLSRKGIYSPADPQPLSLKLLALAIGQAMGRSPPLLLPVPFIDFLSPDTLIKPAMAEYHRNDLYQKLGWRAPCRTADQLGYLS